MEVKNAVIISMLKGNYSGTHLGLLGSLKFLARLLNVLHTLVKVEK